MPWACKGQNISGGLSSQPRHSRQPYGHAARSLPAWGDTQIDRPICAGRERETFWTRLAHTIDQKNQPPVTGTYVGLNAKHVPPLLVNRVLYCTADKFGNPPCITQSTTPSHPLNTITRMQTRLADQPDLKLPLRRTPILQPGNQSPILNPTSRHPGKHYHDRRRRHQHHHQPL